MPQRERSEKTEGKAEVWPARCLAAPWPLPLTQRLTSELQNREDQPAEVSQAQADPVQRTRKTAACSAEVCAVSSVARGWSARAWEVWF
jgi:hypothetical protein